jgi:hypothetical protein
MHVWSDCTWIKVLSTQVLLSKRSECFYKSSFSWIYAKFWKRVFKYVLSHFHYLLFLVLSSCSFYLYLWTGIFGTTKIYAIPLLSEALSAFRKRLISVELVSLLWIMFYGFSGYEIIYNTSFFKELVGIPWTTCRPISRPFLQRKKILRNMDVPSLSSGQYWKYVPARDDYCNKNFNLL